MSIYLEVKCIRCNLIFPWRIGQTKGTCKNCGSISITDVRLTDTTIQRIFN